MTTLVSACTVCADIGVVRTVRQRHDGSWPDTELGTVALGGGGGVRTCPKCGTCYTVRMHAGGMFSDDELEFSRLNPDETAIARILAEDGRDQAKLEWMVEEYLQTHTVARLLDFADGDLAPLIPLAARLLEKETTKESGVSILGAYLGRSARAERQEAARRVLEALDEVGVKTNLAGVAAILNQCTRWRREEPATPPERFPDWRTGLRALLEQFGPPGWNSDAWPDWSAARAGTPVVEPTAAHITYVSRALPQQFHLAIVELHWGSARLRFCDYDQREGDDTEVMTAILPDDWMQSLRSVPWPCAS